MAYQTSSNLYTNTKYIVDGAGGSPYLTIQSAINAANAATLPATVFIRPGVYTENLTLYSGIDLEGSENSAVSIVGLHTPPTSGSLSFNRLGFTSATDVLFSSSAGTTVIKFSRCVFAITNGYICNFTHASWTGTISLKYCTDSSTTNGLIYTAGAAPVNIYNSIIGAGTAKTMTLNSTVELFNAKIGCPVSFAGSSTVRAEGGSTFLGTITTGGSVDVKIRNSTITTGATAAIVIGSSVAMNLNNVVVDSTKTTSCIEGTGTVNFNEATFPNSKSLGAGIVEGLTGVVKTGEIYADTISRMEDTGFYSWAASGPYFDDTTLGTFLVIVGGTGYIKGKKVTWTASVGSPLTVTGMTSGACWWIYIKPDGTIDKTSTRTDALFVDNIVLFECLYDETVGTKQQHTTKENHKYSFPVAASNYLHDTVGAVIENANNGANIVAGTTGVRVSISGDDVLDDHGLDTTITAGTDKTWNKYYKNASGKWAVDASFSPSTDFSGRYNNAGTPTGLAGGKFGVYTLYAGKDNLNSASPIYYAVLDTTQYNNAGAASSAIAAGTTAKADGELASLELAQLGYIVFQAGASIVTITVSKSTLRSTISAGGGGSVASSVTTNTANFDGILSGANTNVQSALETIDDWGKVSTNHGVLIGRGVGVAINATAAGTANQFLISSGASADPAWSTYTMPTTPVQGDILYASSATVMDQLAKDTNATRYLSNTGTNNNPAWAQIALATGVSGQLPVGSGGTGASTLTIHGLLIGNTTSAINAMAAGTAGQIVTSGGASADPAWTTTTYPADVNKGDVLVASADHVIGVQNGAVTAGWVLTANGSGTAPTFQANSGGGIGTLNGDSGSISGPTITIAGGAGCTTSAATTTLTVDVDKAQTAMTSIDFANAGRIGTGTTAADTLLLQAYDVDGTTYTTFATLTANNTPTMDLASAVTIGTNYIYRAGGTDVPVTDGGTGAGTFTQYGIIYGNATSALQVTAAGSTGQMLVGNTGGAASWATIPGSGLTWSVVTSDLNPMVVDNGYIANKAGLLTFTLPTTCAAGKTLRVTGMNTAVGWRIAQNANQIIHFGTSTTTTGAGGYIEAVNIHDSVELVCCVADLEFIVVSSTGNITIA